MQFQQKHWNFGVRYKETTKRKENYKWGKCWNWTGNDGNNTCNIGDSGAKMISEVLKSNSTLTYLNLYSDEKEEYKWKMINEEWYKWNK